jgi:hypothetical protein
MCPHLFNQSKPDRIHSFFCLLNKKKRENPCQKIKFHFSVLYLINLWVRKHKCLFMNIIKIVLYLFLFYIFFLRLDLRSKFMN